MTTPFPPPRAFVTAVFVMVASAQSASAADWPNWRGPNHDGISQETGFEVRWETAPPKVWEREIGSAFSSFACVGGRVYTCGTVEGRQVLWCLDANTGQTVWVVPFEEEYRERQGGDGTRATPAVSDGRVYILGALGRLVCFDAETGKEVWSREFHFKPGWGYAGSVLIEGDLAIVPVGGEDGALVALDKKSGKTVWKCGSGLVGYATPYPFTLEGERYVVGVMGKHVLIADVKTGRQVWSMPWETSWDVNASTPIFHDGRLFISSGYKHGSILLKLSRAGDKLKTHKVWQNENICAKFQSPVLYEGYLYTSDEVDLKCVEFATGVEKWKRRGIKHGTVVIADGHLLVLTEKGELLIGKATPAGFDPLTQARLLKGRHWTVPTLYKGRLYVRNFKQAACFKLTRQ